MNLATANFDTQEERTLQQVCREVESVSNIIDINIRLSLPLNAERVYEAAGRISGLYLNNKGRFALPLQTLHNMLVFASTSSSLDHAICALGQALLEKGDKITPRELMQRTKEIARYSETSPYQ